MTTFFFCVCRAGDDVRALHTIPADNAIDAIRAAAEKSRSGGIWTAYREVVTKSVTIERVETRRILFADPKGKS